MGESCREIDGDLTETGSKGFDIVGKGGTMLQPVGAK